MAIVLAGGRSERFGRDKRLEIVDGQQLLERVITAVGSVADEIVLVLAPGDPPPELLRNLGASVRQAHDTVAYAGPLAGLAAGLSAADGADIALAVGADMPTLQPAVLRLLLERAAAPGGPGAWTLEGPDPSIVGPLPLAGRVADLKTAAGTLLDAGQRSLRSLVRELDAGRIPAADWRGLDPDGLTLRDIDRPEDLVR
ncbi:MAG TPA: NTP transferase domain-containing protein [Candidatus Polarisedimenticolia bacterium]|nr:NTP transferase domain-containing protein [Candidatus Polarisedimenticolia bacterium]